MAAYLVSPARLARGALAPFQRLRRLYNVPRQEFAFYLQLRRFLLAAPTRLSPTTGDRPRISFPQIKVCKRDLFLRRCCLFGCNNSHALKGQENGVENRVAKCLVVQMVAIPAGWVFSYLIHILIPETLANAVGQNVVAKKM